MSKYDDLREAARIARKNWFEQRNRWGYMARLVNGFTTYCDVSSDRIVYLRLIKNGEEMSYKQAEQGQRYTLMGATEYDDADTYWHLGIGVILTPPNTFPPQWFSFVFCVKEEQGNVWVKIGRDGKARRI